MKEIPVSTESRTQFVDITARVAAAASELGVKDGAVVVFVPHTTAGVTTDAFS